MTVKDNQAGEKNIPHSCCPHSIVHQDNAAPESQSDQQGSQNGYSAIFLRASSKLDPRPVFSPGLLPTEFSFVMFHLVCCWAFKTSQSIRIQLIIMAYLSLFLERSEHSIPSIRFVKHLSMAGCLSTCWLDMIFVLSLPKYYNKDNNAHVSEIHL